EPGRRPVEEGVVVGLRYRPALPERGVRDPRRVREVGDVEERDLRAGRLVVRADVLPDAEQEVVPDRMQVGRVAGDRQRPEHLRVRGIGDVDRVQRVDLLERDYVAVVADEAHRVDTLALPEPAELADLVELAAARA